ncbi:MAG: hypothetical protein AABX01_06760 [Candidatus Micrarchaeota archaeon]
MAERSGLPKKSREPPEGLMGGRIKFRVHGREFSGFAKPLQHIILNLQRNAHRNGLTREQLFMLGTAYNFTEEIHRGQTRENDVPYVSHCRRVGMKVSKYGGDVEQTIIGLLNDAIEQGRLAQGPGKEGAKSPVTHELLKNLFNERIANGVAAISTGKVVGGNMILPQNEAYHYVLHDDTDENYLVREDDLMKRVLAHGMDAILPKIMDHSDNMFTAKGMKNEKWPSFYLKSKARVDRLSDVLAASHKGAVNAKLSLREAVYLKPIIERELWGNYRRMRNFIASKLGKHAIDELDRQRWRDS